MWGRTDNYEQLMDNLEDLAEDFYKDEFDRFEDDYEADLTKHIIKTAGLNPEDLDSVEIIDSDIDEGYCALITVGITLKNKAVKDKVIEATESFKFSSTYECETSFRMDVDEYDDYTYDVDAEQDSEGLKFLPDETDEDDNLLYLNFSASIILDANNVR